MKEENSIFKFVQVLIKRSEKYTEDANMTDEQKKEYIHGVLMNHFEIAEIDPKEIFPIYKRAYPNFSSDEFFKYVISHTKDADIIFKEKLKIEKKR